jgi:ElaB/YqjD/DUF883 family membrane-anchored ribosome-binding protein
MTDPNTETAESTTSTIEDLRDLIREAESALASGQHAGEEFSELRERLREAVADGQNLIGKLSDNVRKHVRRADDAVRSNPYQTAGIAAGIGLLAGFLLSQRHARGE